MQVLHRDWICVQFSIFQHTDMLLILQGQSLIFFIYLCVELIFDKILWCFPEPQSSEINNITMSSLVNTKLNVFYFLYIGLVHNYCYFFYNNFNSTKTIKLFRENSTSRTISHLLGSRSMSRAQKTELLEEAIYALITAIKSSRLS